MLIIRTFTPSDLKEVMALANRTLGEVYNPGIYTAIFQVIPQGFIVAHDESRVVGFCVVVPEVESLRILMLSVHENYRRHGIGSSMMKEALARFLSHGYKRLTLEVREGNDESILFYKKLGFIISSMMPGYYSNGDNAYRMEKVIG